MSGWESEHLLAADDVTVVGLCVVFQFDVFIINLKKGLINILVSSCINYTCQVRLIT